MIKKSPSGGEDACEDENLSFHVKVNSPNGRCQAMTREGDGFTPYLSSALLLFACLSMSELRRRIFGVGGSTPDSTPSTSRDASPAPGNGKKGKESHDSEYTAIPKKQLDKLRKDVKQVKRKGIKRRNAWVFVLGGVFGICVAGFFASSNGSLDRLVELAGMQDLNLETLFDVLPAGLIKDVQDMQVCNLCLPLSASSQADVDQGVFDRRHMRKRLSTMIHSLLASQLDRKASKRSFLSS